MYIPGYGLRCALDTGGAIRDRRLICFTIPYKKPTTGAEDG